MAVVVVLGNLVAGPGFAHALAGRWRVGALWVAGFLAAGAGVLLSPWLGVVALAAGVGSMVHAAIYLRRLPRPVRWRWLPAVFVAAATLVAVGVLRTAMVATYKAPASSMVPTLAIGDHFYVNLLASPGRGDIVVFRHPCQPEVDYVKRVIAVGGETVEIRCGVVHVDGVALAQQPLEGPCSYRDEHEDMVGGAIERTIDCRHARETLAGRTYDVYFASTPEPFRSDFPRDEPPRRCSPTGAADEPTSVVRTAETTDPCARQAHLVVPPGTLFVLGDNRDNSNDSRYWGVVPVTHVKGTVTGIWWPPGRIGAVD